MKLERLPGAPHLTYCTNIHAGETWPEIETSLSDHVPRIRAALDFDGPFGIGLRLSGLAADELIVEDRLAAFKASLTAMDAYVFTINAFPYGPFHGVRVKEEVYQPDWQTTERVRFSNQSADILAQLLPDGMTGSVSTVPGTFKSLANDQAVIDTMTANYVRHAAHLVNIERRTGKLIALSIEPEPCCFIETIAETVSFFKDQLFGTNAQKLLAMETGLADRDCETALRRHLGVCYDVCHAAVEYEDAAGSLRALSDAGITITKLQLSAAMAVRQVSAKTESLLKRYDEGVYLHQTIQKLDGQLTRFVDLPEAFTALQNGQAGGEWRIHCHVPVFLTELDELASTQDFLIEILEICKGQAVSPHLEVETYTWDVLPDALRGDDKAKAIARELSWVRTQLSA